MPKVFKELFKPHRYKAFYGGRGGGKSHAYASSLVIQGAKKKIRVLCCREIQKSIKDSVKALIDDKINSHELNGFYHSTESQVIGGNGTQFLFAGLKNNPESIKSMEAIDIAWVEEANRVSQRSLDLLVPTIRADDSEIWFSWNPENELDPVDMKFRGQTPPPDSLIKMVSYNDNPFFPNVLKKEMDFDLITNPIKYEHVWLGGYRLITEGAYYQKQIVQAINDGRICRVPYDPHVEVIPVFDLGISDLTSIWFAQFVGKEVHIIDFLQSNGQPIEYYLQELRAKPYVYGSLVLPHDARARELGTGKTIEEVIRGFGFDTVICPNIGVIDGIDSARSFLVKCWFDQEKCEEGLKHLRAYIENYDEKLRISRGPLHNKDSHAADAFRYLSVSSDLIGKIKSTKSTYAKDYVFDLNA